MIAMIAKTAGICKGRRGETEDRSQETGAKAPIDGPITHLPSYPITKFFLPFII
jgi:hypothetical protein